MKLAPAGMSERLYVRVARRIAELVTSEGVKAGEKLPSERESALMSQLPPLTSMRKRALVCLLQRGSKAD